MRSLQYYDLTQAVNDAETTMTTIWVIVAIFAILFLCMVVAIVSMAKSLQDIRGILREHFIIGELPEAKKDEEIKPEIIAKE